MPSAEVVQKSKLFFLCLSPLTNLNIPGAVLRVALFNVTLRRRQLSHAQPRSRCPKVPMLPCKIFMSNMLAAL